MERFADLAHRFRWPIVLVWVAVAVASAVASSGLGDLLSNRFELPGTEAKAVDGILERHFAERGDSSALVIARFAGSGPPPAAFRADVDAATRRAAAALPGSLVGPQQAAGDVLYTTVGTTLPPDEAQRRVDAMRDALLAQPVACLLYTSPSPRDS